MKRYTKSVADFLVANRCAGRYLLSISQGASGIGAISIVAWFEMYYNAGFTAAWWQMLVMPITLLVALSGWIIYRFRETRAMTMAQFFEMRYSRNFRVFTGIIAWVTGIINMGIFPAVTARFFMYFMGLPHNLSFMGFEISTFATIMFIELSIALLFTFLGGMTMVIITDFLQGIFCYIVFLVILIFLLSVFEWNQIVTAIQKAPENASMINPFKTTKADGFNLGFFLMQAFVTVYCIRAWQGAQGYNAAAKNAHEAKMAGIIGNWRGLVQVLLVTLLPICAYTLLHHPDFSSKAQIVRNMISAIDNEQIQKQMTTPLALIQIFPLGMLGLFVTVMLAGAISTDETYLHSWGSIFIQDVILPFRKKSFKPQQQLLLLRLSILFVAVFIFCFSLLFKQNDFIMMFFEMTGAIYLGGAGSVIVGGLYWKIGSAKAAWGAMITGGLLAFGGLILRQIWSDIQPSLIQFLPKWQVLIQHPDSFPYNGMQIEFFAILCAILVYISLSLWDYLVLKKPAFNMDKMLHRGEYAIHGEHTEQVKLPATGLKALLPDKEFTKFDKFLHYSLTAWLLGWFSFFIIVTTYHLIWGTSDRWWLNF